MNVNSLQFLGFVFIVWGFYFCSPKNYRWFILLLASYIFYFLSSQFLVGFIVLSSVSIYLAAKVMNKYDAEMKTCLKESERQEKKIFVQSLNKKREKFLFIH